MILPLEYPQYDGPPPGYFELNRESPAARGLVAWWPPLGSRGTNRLREWFSGDGGVFVNDVLYRQNAALGSVTDYDGVNDRIEYGDVDRWDMGTSDFSISCWINFTAIQPDDYEGTTLAILAGKGTVGSIPGYSLFLSNEEPAIQIRNAAFASAQAQSPIAYNDGVNHLITGVCDRSSATGLKLYVDGVERANDNPVAIGNIDTPASFGFGSRQDLLSVWSWDYNGALGEARLYSRALTPGENWRMYSEQWDLYLTPGMAWAQAIAISVSGRPTRLYFGPSSVRQVDRSFGGYHV